MNTDADIGGIALHTGEDADTLAERLAGDVATVLERAIEARGGATLVVSGGSTPPPMFERLRRLPLDWARVTITLADERVVEPADEQSNERLVKRMLLLDEAAAARWVSLYEDGLDSAQPDAALSRVAARVAALPGPFDVVLLGMGGDGHTASLFPDAAELESAMSATPDVQVALLRPPSQPLTRLSLVAARLCAARHLWLHITGESKRALLADSLSVESARDGLPIARVLRKADTDRAIYWAP